MENKVINSKIAFRSTLKDNKAKVININNGHDDNTYYIVRNDEKRSIGNTKLIRVFNDGSNYCIGILGDPIRANSFHDLSLDTYYSATNSLDVAKELFINHDIYKIVVDDSLKVLSYEKVDLSNNLNKGITKTRKISNN